RALRFDLPPDCVPARTARADRRLVAQRAVVALEGGEHDTALMRLVAVLEDVQGHALSFGEAGSAHIGATPRSRPPLCLSLNPHPHGVKNGRRGRGCGALTWL